MNADIALKSEVRIDDFLDMHPNLFIIFGYFCFYAKSVHLPVLVTSMFSDPVEGRISRAHETGRAIDLSIRGWPVDKINTVVAFVEGKCSYLGAIGKDGKRRALIVHDSGSGQHFHAQCAA